MFRRVAWFRSCTLGSMFEPVGSEVMEGRRERERKSVSGKCSAPRRSFSMSSFG